MISCYLDLVGRRDKQVMDKYFNLFLDNCNIGYAEVFIVKHIYAWGRTHCTIDESTHRARSLHNRHQPMAAGVPFRRGVPTSLSDLG